MEEFYTLQGEGFHTGKAAYFLRIGGCDVGCHWCDVKESWNADLHPLKPVEEVIENAAKWPARTVVITGGEPLSYNLKHVCAEFSKQSFDIHVETSGAYALQGTIDWMCLSPKKMLPPLPENLARADELKVIVYNQSDFEWAEKMATSLKPECMLFLQPEWSKREKNMPLIIDYIMKNPKWRISLQTHKYLHIP